MINLKGVELIFDNGGGITLQKLLGRKYLHSYMYEDQLAEDIFAILNGNNPAADWDGNEIGEYKIIDVSYNDVANGGYRVYRLDNFLDIVKDKNDEEFRDDYDFPGDSWSNIETTIREVRKLLDI